MGEVIMNFTAIMRSFNLNDIKSSGAARPRTPLLLWKEMPASLANFVPRQIGQKSTHNTTLSFAAVPIQFFTASDVKRPTLNSDSTPLTADLERRHILQII